MPVLQDPKHEAFAQALAKGMNQSDAYKAAGYKAKGDSIKVNASRLLTKANIEARVTELQAKVAAKVVDNSAFEAKTMFEAVLQDIEDAKKAGDYKTAADLRKFFISCFGYEDSPTLTHEHVKGSKLATAEQPEEGNAPQAAPDRANVVMLAQAIKKAQRRAG